MNIKIAKQLIKIAKKLINAYSIQIERSVIDFIWNKIKSQPNSRSTLFYNDKQNKTIELSSAQLESLFDCDFYLQPLKIIILNINCFDKLKNIQVFKSAIKYKNQYSNHSGGYSSNANYIFIYYGTKIKQDENSPEINNFLKNIFKQNINDNSSEIKKILKHELIHYYKDKILKLKQDSKTNVDFKEYINSDAEYDSWIINVSSIILKDIKNAQIKDNKIERIYRKNGYKSGIQFQNYIKNFLTIYDKKQYEIFKDFLQKGKKDILKNIQETLIYKINAQKVYENIKDAKKDIENNYYYLYKAINKGLIHKNDKIILDVVKKLLQKNKVHNIKVLFENNKLTHFMPEINKMFEEYKNNEKIYFNLMNLGLVDKTAEYQQQINLQNKVNSENYIDELIDLYMQNLDNKKICWQILNKLYNGLDDKEMLQQWLNILNEGINAFDDKHDVLYQFCKQKNIELLPIQQFD